MSDFLINYFSNKLNEIVQLLDNVTDFIEPYKLTNGDKIDFSNLNIELRDNLTTIFSQENQEIFFDLMNNHNLIDNIKQLEKNLKNLLTKSTYSADEKFKEYTEIAEIFNLFITESLNKIKNKKLKYFEIDSLLKDAERLNKESAIFKEKILTQKTEEIYQKNSETYLGYANSFDNRFYILLSIVVLVSLITLGLFSTERITFEVFLYLKILIVTVSITMATLFLRKASHYRKLHHTYQHIHLELTALPIYLYNIPEEQHAEIYKTLISTYFGNSIDSSQIDKSSNLINEQIKNSIELIKVSAEVTKAANKSQEK